MARAVARRSLCSRDQVGAIIVDRDNKVIGEGHNGPPRGFFHDQRRCLEWCQRAQRAPVLTAHLGSVSELHPTYDDCPSLHGEANCLMMSDRSLRAGGTIYVTSHVCFSCAKLIANSGLRYVYVTTGEEHAHRSSAVSYDFLVYCGLYVTVNGERWEKK
jgi:dCMP deaminase